MNKRFGQASLERKEIANFSLFSLGKLLSVFGTSIYTFAIGLHVLKTTGSGLSFAATLTFSFIPIAIFGPLSGVIADKLNKKKTIILMDILNAMLFAILFIITSVNEISLILIYASTFISTTLTTIFSTSMGAGTPYLVLEKRLIHINSASRIIDSIASILAPIVGGLIFALIDIRLFMLINAISFGVSSILEAFLDFNFNRIENIIKEKTKINFTKDIINGVKFIINRKDIKIVILMIIAVNFFLGISVTVPLPYIINAVLKLKAIEFGLIESMFPIGIIIGALIVKKILSKHSYDTVLLYSSIAISICTLLLGVPLLIQGELSNTVYVVYFSALMIPLGITLSLFDIPIIFRLQKTVQDEYRGRVLSIGTSIGKLVLPIALIAAGLLIDLVFPAILVFSGGAILLAISTFILRYGKIDKDKKSYKNNDMRI